jgi:type VI secretion system protein ImpJ
VLKGNSRVIWKEGMFLEPQHFQQESRFIEHSATARFASMNPFFYGVTDVCFENGALANGAVTLASCAGIFPDGTVFSIPREDDPPASRSFIEHFTHEQQTCDVFLGLPLVAEGRPCVTVASDAAGASNVSSRYRSREMTVIDETDGTRSKLIEVGSRNLSLLFGDENSDDFTTIRIGRLMRNPNGQVELQDNFIPPLAQIGGSEGLLRELRGLLEILLAKSGSLSQGRREKTGGTAIFSASEAAAFRLLETINTYAPVINHFHYEPRVHPFELFKVLTQLTGALTTFSSEVSLKDLPRYDHDNPGGTFGCLIKMIRSVLESGMDAGCVVVPIDQINPATFVVRLPNDRLLTTAKFFLGVSAKASEKELIIGVAQRIKMSSRDRLDVLISSAMPGLSLIHTSNPPEGLSTKPGFLYFALDQQSQFWRGIQGAGSIAFYFPNNYPDLKLEMLALRGQ